MKWVVALLAIVIIIGGVWFATMRGPKTTTTKTEQVTATGETNTIEVTKTDITQNGISNLPVGFPDEIPVEANNLTESYRAAYKSRGLTQYTVSFTSLKSRESLWDMYADYMNDSGYSVDNSSSKSQGQISATRDNDSLSVVVSSHEGLSLVQINYIER